MREIYQENCRGTQSCKGESPVEVQIKKENSGKNSHLYGHLEHKQMYRNVAFRQELNVAQCIVAITYFYEDIWVSECISVCYKVECRWIMVGLKGLIYTLTNIYLFYVATGSSLCVWLGT